MFEYKQFYRRNLPHRHSPGATLFITFRLAGSIPKSLINQYRIDKQLVEREIAVLLANNEKKDDPSQLSASRRLDFHRTWFKKFEDILHKHESGPLWMKDERIARLVFDSFLHRDGSEYDLKSLCVMANHVHAVIRPYLTERSIVEIEHSTPIRFQSLDPPISVIMRSLKGYTARKANQILNRRGTFWEAESYDHEIRDESSFFRINKYVLNNPVKANLVETWRDWKWTYLADDLSGYF